MIIYMDGSGTQDIGFKKRLLSWGLVVHHNDETTELHGCLREVPQQFEGFHELLAFAEAVRYVRYMKVPFEQVSFYTDDDVITRTSDGNSWEKIEKAKNRLMMLVNEFYPSTVYDDMMECWEKSRFTKVKGHRDTVYNLRVDYLAAHARKTAAGAKNTLLTFEKWLAEGVRFYDYKNEKFDVWYAPFATNLDL
jgi:ribonuclease HI